VVDAYGRVTGWTPPHASSRRAVYADAGHSFLNDHDPTEASVVFKVLAKVSGSKYHEGSALDARRRIIAFFDEHLKVPGA
jgi:carboxymethylenebutenolidase